MDKSNYQPIIDQPIVASGMYVATDQLKDAWSALFQSLQRKLDFPGSQRLSIRHDCSEAIYTDPNFFLGQTCGYPYVTRWKHSHDLLAVPVFDFDGCKGTQYSSWFITHRENSASKIEDFRHKTVTLNGHDSNSGMNVLRYEISKLNCPESFFDEVIISGGHATSIKLIEEKKADLAAIDSVSYAHLLQAGLFDPNKIRIIGQSEMTTGLPFITPKNFGFRRAPDQPVFNAHKLIEQLNESLETLTHQQQRILGLDSFESVCADDYCKVAQLKSKAEESGYPLLR